MKTKKSKIIAVCISKNRGVRKKPVLSAQCIENYGIDGDAHAGSPEKQVSFLSVKDINKMKELGVKISHGDFAENIVVDGDVLDSIVPGDLLKISNGPEFIVTTIGKTCHNDGCPIKKQTGTCIMPDCGVFAKVIKSGKIEAHQNVLKN